MLLLTRYFLGLNVTSVHREARPARPFLFRRFLCTYLPPAQTHFAPFNPLKSRRCELIQMSTTKEDPVLKWTLKAFELFIGTRSLISLKSPLTHFSVSLWPACCCACVSVCVLCDVFMPDHRILDGYFPGEISISEIQRWARINICTNLSILSMFAVFCTILYILSNILTIKQGIQFTATVLSFLEMWCWHLSYHQPGGAVMHLRGQQGADGCTVKKTCIQKEKSSMKPRQLCHFTASFIMC